MRKSNAVAKNFFGEDLPDLRELAQNTSLFLVNSHFSTNQARPTVPNFIEVAGLHASQPKALPKVIFVSLENNCCYSTYSYAFMLLLIFFVHLHY